MSTSPHIVSLWDMLQNDQLGKLLYDQAFVSAMAQWFHGKTLLTYANKAQVEECVSRLGSYAVGLRAFGLNVGARHAERVAELVGKSAPEPKYNNEYLVDQSSLFTIRDSLNYLHNSGLSFEAQEKRFLLVPPRYAEMLTDDYSLFGKLVDTKFPSVIRESQEAAKCFALSRWTASAFHALRCLEAAIKGVYRSLGIPEPTTGAGRNWSQISRSITDKMKEKWPNASDRASADYLFFEKILASFSTMQNPYRNETMHLAGDYDEESARHLIDMVRGLMNRTAERCDENGHPLA